MHSPPVETDNIDEATTNTSQDEPTPGHIQNYNGIFFPFDY
jgi:hypothetical protein